MGKVLSSLWIIISLVAAGSIHAQTSVKLTSAEFNKEIAPSRALMNRENISIRFKKEIFEDVNSKVLLESSTGMVCRGKDINYKMMNDGLVVVQTDELKVIVDSVNMLIQLGEVESELKSIDFLGDLPLNMLDNYELEKTTYPNHFVFKASPKNADDAIMEMFINNKDKSLYKLVVTMQPANYFSESLSDETLESPYVTIVYEPLQTIKNAEAMITYQPYIQKNQSGKYELTPAFSAYQLHDSRYRPTNE